MSEWQPIETAPKDGEIVLGYWHNGEMHTGQMRKGEWLPAWDNQDHDWNIPAYWMPLPEPPQP